ncbi:MAG TPA: hypothetical protein VGN12_19500 [Pirellulales bacterium]|jgi:hypothetical protein
MNVMDLTLNDVQSYAAACKAMHDYIETLRMEGYDLLVVPSRGAHPFLQAAKSYAHNQTAATRGPRLFAPPLVRMEELYLPFTADIASDQNVSSSAIRGYWSRVLAAILRGDKSEPAYRFYEFLRQQAGSLAVGVSQVRPRNHFRFIFVDTVVSGRAITEIFGGFAAYGLSECHFLLLLDKGGRDLKPEYKRAIDAMVARGRATTIPVDNIFTEDEGPAMSGIWTVTMPELMNAALTLPAFAGTGQAAATLFYWEIRRRDDRSNLPITVSNGHLSTMLYSAVADGGVTGLFLKDFQDHVSGSHLQDQALTKEVAWPVVSRNLPIRSIDVTGSHVVRGRMDAKTIEGLIRKFSNP